MVQVPNTSQSLAGVLWTVCALLWLFACGSANSLTGSISESHDLSFNTVRLRRQQEFISVEYLRYLGERTEKVCKLVVDVSDLDLEDGLRIDGEAFTARVELLRATHSNDAFPAVEHGDIWFNHLEDKNWAEVQGGFDIVFDNGRNLEGRFNELLTFIENPAGTRSRVNKQILLKYIIVEHFFLLNESRILLIASIKWGSREA